MRARNHRIAAASMSLALVLGGVACGDDSDGEGGVEGDEVEQEIQDGVDDLQDGAEDLGDEVEQQLDEGTEEDGESDDGS